MCTKGDKTMGSRCRVCAKKILEGEKYIPFFGDLCFRHEFCAPKYGRIKKRKNRTREMIPYRICKTEKSVGRIIRNTIKDD